jgi:hypothetical protein
MVDKNNETETKVSLEDLLKVKRGERPTEQFWGEFDRELHHKMLQTLVKKDPIFIQIMRGLTGRVAQTGAVATMAAICVIALGRSLWTNVAEQSSDAQTFAEVDQSSVSDTRLSKGLLENANDLDSVLAMADSSLVDYEMAGLDGTGLSDSAGMKRDFTMESMHLASFDSGAYSSDVASISLAFVNQSVASLVY